MTRRTSSAPGRRDRSRRRGATAVLLVSLVGVGAWGAAGAASRALGLEGPGLPGLGEVVPGAGSDDVAQPAPAPTAPTKAAPGPGEQTGPATGLDPVLAERFAAAQAAAAAEGVTLTLTSGWRTPEEQQALVDEALVTYGSAEEAHRWVLPPEVSAHVAGLAIDVGPLDGATWLGERADRFGLCRTYLNEWWHFEPMPADGVCPEPHADSSWGWR